MKAVLDIIGGVRAAVFLGLFLAALAGLGIQSHRLDTRTEERDAMKAEALVWASAQKTNMETIAKQARALEQWRGIAGEREAQAQAAAREAAGLQEALEAERERRKNERQVIYDRNPEARQWGATRVPAELADQLRQ